jgi:tRNA U34 2-thiouridine synthase MnmA/TrmU
MSKVKCLLLYSGGLDSILVKRILEDQGIKVGILNLGTCFFKGDKNVSEEYLDIVKNPQYGRGQGMNPCRDCHLFMLKKAKEEMEKGEYDFIATGEVVAQRPFSQSKNQLVFLEEKAGLKGLILRPLSAKLLEETIAEKKGLVDRDKLYDISGKTRKKQLELAKEFGIEDFPSPAGGCILTDKEYSKRLKNLIEIRPDFSVDDCVVIQKGRVVFDNNVLYVITRNEKEGIEIEKIKKENDLLLVPDNFSGPSVLIRSFDNDYNDGIIKKGEELLLKYSKKIPENYLIKSK